MKIKIYQGSALKWLKKLPDESVDCCVTSPPYWGLRSYKTKPQIWDSKKGCEHEWDFQKTGHDNLRFRKGESSVAGNHTNKDLFPDMVVQTGFCLKCGAWKGELGLEPTPELFIKHLTRIFREVRRVLKPTGTLWLNLGDSYATHQAGGKKSKHNFRKAEVANDIGHTMSRPFGKQIGLKEKDLIGIPWMAAFALRTDGWYLRQDIIWYKKAPMPESVQDRCTKAHEYIFLFSKSKKYYFDNKAIGEALTTQPHKPGNNFHEDKTAGPNDRGGKSQWDDTKERSWCKQGFRNKRSVWDINTEAFSEAHFATFPKALIEPMIKAGTSEKGCCSKCGAPWERTSEKVGDKKYEYKEIGIPGEGKNRGRRKAGMMGYNQYEAKGWAPSCKCKAQITPSIVIDPFFGSGTTGIVANSLGKDAIGIELNEKYVDIAKKRITKEAGIMCDLTIKRKIKK